MNTQKDRSHDRTTTDLAGLIPHADKPWIEELVTELRLLDVPGPRIGDALATVEQHLVETGDSVEEAFGPAKDYARAVAESQVRAGGTDRVTVLSSTLGVLGIILAPRALAAALEGTRVSVTTGDLAALALLGVLIAGVIAFATPILRTITENRKGGFILWVLSGVIVTSAMVGLFLLWRTTLMTLTPWLVGGLALAGVAGAAWLSSRQHLDLIATPDGRTLGGHGSARLANTLLFPGLALLMCLVTWLTWALA